MTETHIPLGHLGQDSISRPWIVVFGGVTRIGNRRARRAAARALSWGMDVVWFDGYEEVHPSGSRVRLKASPTDGAKVVVVGFRNEESSGLAGRLRNRTAGDQEVETSRLWSPTTRRVGNLLRSRACWTAVREDVRRISGIEDPKFIVFTDDHMITSAWYAGRIWAATPICSDLPWA